MGWYARLLMRRARAQSALLAVVAGVALLATSLLGTFTLLLTASQDRMVGVALDRTRAEDRELDVVVRPRAGDRTLLDGADQLVTDTLGTVPATRETWLASAMYTVRGTADAVQPYVYLGSEPEIARSSVLLSGAFPTAAVDESGRVLVAVPQVAAEAYGWQVGTVVDVAVGGRSDRATLVVTGTFRLTGPASSWHRDPLAGAEEDAAYPVLGSAGFLTTRAWGPLVTAGPDVLTDGTVQLGTAHLVAHPDLGQAGGDEVAALRSRLDDAERRLAALTVDGGDARIESYLADTIDAAAASLRVTQVTVVVVALLLVVLAITVLLGAARLLAERRAPEQRLLSSRGASAGQLTGVAGLEALGVAVVTAALAPWLAGGLYHVLTASGPVRDGGLHVDPGRPAELWLVCSVCALVLAGVLLAPAVRLRTATGAGRADRTGALARSGADIALVVLAVVAFRQLSTYQNPIGSAGSADPVLVLAPALVLLAGAVLTLRLLPVLTRAGERLASRSRGLASPLAAWELGRRPGRASASVLLLTLAIGVGTFSLSFLSTWRSSQQDQADLATGTDVRVVPADELAAAASAAGLPGVEHVAPVTLRDASVGIASSSGDTTLTTTVLAVDTTQAGALLRGRVAGGWESRTRHLRPTTPVEGVPLPGVPRYLVVDLRTTLSAPVVGSVRVWAVLQDPTGERSTVALRTLELEDSWTDVVVPVSAVAGTSLVGVVARGTPSTTDAPPAADVAMTLEVAHLRVATGPPLPADGQVPPVAELAGVSAVSLTDGRWDTAHRTTVDADVLHLESTVLSGIDYGAPVALAGTTFADPGADGLRIPALVTPDLLDALSTDVGRSLRLTVTGAPVDLQIVGTVPYLPGHPAGSGVLVDSDLLGRAAMVAAGEPPPTDEWWLSVQDARAAAVASTIETTGGGVAHTRVAARTDATDGPLRVGVQAALWVVVAAAVVLAVAGIAMSATVSVRARRLELARLQALGVARTSLVRSLLLEHVVVATLGLAAGVAIGAFLARAVAPLVTVSSTGGTPVPGVVVHAGWSAQLVLLGMLLASTVAVVAVVTNVLLKRASGELLRLGDDQ